MFPGKDELRIFFAHVAYQLGTRFAARNTGIHHAHTWNRDELDRTIRDARRPRSQQSDHLMIGWKAISLETVDTFGSRALVTDSFRQ